MKEKVFAILAFDKDRGGKFSDEEFLAITKSIFSVFRKDDVSGKIKYVIDVELFNGSLAKGKIEAIIQEVNNLEDEYQEEIRKYDLEQQFGGHGEDDKDNNEHPEPGKDEESEIDKLVRQSSEREQDLSLLSPSELQVLIDDALDNGDYAEVKRLSAYLGESANIYLNELERINERKHN